MAKIWDALAEAGHLLDSGLEQFGEVSTDIGKTLQIDTGAKKIGLDDAGRWFWRDVGKPFMAGYEKSYRGITRPITTVALVPTAKTFSASGWSEAWDASRNISPGQALTRGAFEGLDVIAEIFGIENISEPFSNIYEFGDDFESSFEELTGSGGKSEFDIYDQEQRERAFGHGMAKWYSGNLDALSRWYLDPFIVGGKIAKIGKIAGILRPLGLMGESSEAANAAHLAKLENIAGTNGRVAGNRWTNTGRAENFINDYMSIADKGKRIDQMRRDPLFRKNPALAEFLGRAENIDDMRQRLVVAMDTRWAPRISVQGNLAPLQAEITEFAATKIKPFEDDLARVYKGDLEAVPTDLLAERTKLFEQLARHEDAYAAEKIMYDAMGQMPFVPRTPIRRKVGQAVERSDKFGGPGVSWGLYQPGHLNYPMRIIKAGTTQRPGVIDHNDPTSATSAFNEFLDSAARIIGRDMDPVERRTLSNNVGRAAVTDHNTGEAARAFLGPNLNEAILDGERHVARLIAAKYGIGAEDANMVLKEYTDRRVKIRVTVENTRNQRLTAQRQAKAGVDEMGIPKEVPFADDPIFSGGTYGGRNIDEIINIAGNIERRGIVNADLMNATPLMDIELFVKFLKREQRTIREHGPEMRKSLATRTLSGNELVNEALETMNRFWKPAQLLRLGWPQRVLVDEFMRAAAVMGATEHVLNASHSLRSAARITERRPFITIRDLSARGRIKNAQVRVAAAEARAAENQQARLALADARAELERERGELADRARLNATPTHWTADDLAQVETSSATREAQIAELEDAATNGVRLHSDGESLRIGDDLARGPEDRAFMSQEHFDQHRRVNSPHPDIGTGYLEDQLGAAEVARIAAMPKEVAIAELNRRLGINIRNAHVTSTAEALDAAGKRHAGRLGVGLRNDTNVWTTGGRFDSEADLGYLRAGRDSTRAALDDLARHKASVAEMTQREADITRQLQELNEADVVGALPGILGQLNEVSERMGQLDEESERLLGELNGLVEENVGSRIMVRSEADEIWSGDGDLLYHGAGLTPMHIRPREEGARQDLLDELNNFEGQERPLRLPAVGMGVRTTDGIHSGSPAVDYLRSVVSLDELARVEQLDSATLLDEIADLERGSAEPGTEYARRVEQYLDDLREREADGMLPRTGNRGELSQSVVRDEAGKLILVHHGTSWRFEQFNDMAIGGLGGPGGRGWFGDGHYFTVDPAYAGTYLDPDYGGRVMSSYLDLRKVWDWDKDLIPYADAKRLLAEHHINIDEFSKRMNWRNPPDWSGGVTMAEIKKAGGLDNYGDIPDTFAQSAFDEAEGAWRSRYQEWLRYNETGDFAATPPPQPGPPPLLSEFERIPLRQGQINNMLSKHIEPLGYDGITHVETVPGPFAAFEGSARSYVAFKADAVHPPWSRADAGGGQIDPLVQAYAVALARSNGHRTLWTRAPGEDEASHGMFLGLPEELRPHNFQEDVVRMELGELFSEMAEQGALRSDLLGKESAMQDAISHIEEISARDVRELLRPSDMINRQVTRSAWAEHHAALKDEVVANTAENARATKRLAKIEAELQHKRTGPLSPHAPGWESDEIKASVLANFEETSAWRRGHGPAPTKVQELLAEREQLMEGQRAHAVRETRATRAGKIAEDLGRIASTEGGPRQRAFGGMLTYENGGFSVEANDALAGTYGPIYVNKTSAKSTSRALANITEEMHKRLKILAGDTVTLTAIPPKNATMRRKMLWAETYNRGWERAANEQIGMDPMMRKLLEGKSDDAIKRWLREEPDGVEYFRKADSVRKASVDYWLGVAKIHIEHYLPTAELRELAYQGRARADDLRRWNQTRYDQTVQARRVEDAAAPPSSLADPKSTAIREPLDPDAGLPMIHAQSIDEITSGTAVGRHWAAFVDKSYKYIGTLPTDVLTRQPLFAGIYRREMRTAFMQSGLKGSDHVPESFIAEIERNARRTALREVKRTVYDVANESNLSHMMRYILPFYAAWQDALQTWARIWMDDPSVLGKMMQLWQAPTKSGNVYTDPEGKQYMNTPLPGFMKNAPILKNLLPTGEAAGMPADALKSLIFQGEYWYMPGFGPPVTVPVSALVRDRPDTYDMVKPIIPYGAGDGYLDSILPAGWKRLVSKWRSDTDPDYAKALVRASMDVQTDLRLGKIDPMTDTEAAAEAKRRTDGLFTVKVFANFGLPFSPTYRSPYQSFIDSYRKLQTEEREDPVKFADTYGDGLSAQDVFLDTYGDEYLAFTAATTKSNIGGIDVSNVGYEAFNEYRDLIQQAPDMGSLIVGGVKGEYSGEVSNWMLRERIGPNSTETAREIRDPQTALRDSEVSRAWDLFRTIDAYADAALRERGLTSLRAKGAADIKKARATQILNLMERFPAWKAEFGSFNRNAADRRVDFMGKMIEDPRILARPGYAELADYLNFRQIVVAELNKRKAKGGSNNLTAQANQDLQERFVGYTQGLKLSNTYFADIWARWLAADDLDTGGSPL